MFRSQLQRVCLSAVRIGQCRQMQQKAERSVNQVTLLGRVGKDVELKGSDEHPMASFSLATSENIRSKHPDETGVVGKTKPLLIFTTAIKVNSKSTGQGEFTQKTSWHRICIFKPGLVDIVYTYCKKGDRLYVTGKLDYSEYTNNDGIKVYQTSVIADEVIFLTSENRRDGY